MTHSLSNMRAYLYVIILVAYRHYKVLVEGSLRRSRENGMNEAIHTLVANSSASSMKTFAISSCCHCMCFGMLAPKTTWELCAALRKAEGKTYYLESTNTTCLIPRYTISLVCLYWIYQRKPLTCPWARSTCPWTTCSHQYPRSEGLPWSSQATAVHDRGCRAFDRRKPVPAATEY